MEFYPEATQPGEAGTENYRRDASRSTDFTQFLQRIDFQESDGSTWFGRWSEGNEPIADPGTFPDQTSRTNTRVSQGMVSNTRAFSPTVLNELRASYNRFDNDRIGHFAFDRDVGSELEIIGLPTKDPAEWGSPLVGLTAGLRSFGESNDGPWVNRNHTFQVLDNLSLVRGSHSIKFGVELRRDHYNHLGSQISRGRFNFSGNATFDPAARETTGHSFADFLLGESTRSTVAVGSADAKLRATSVYFYVQDTWRVSPTLTIDFGLRYERTPAFHDKHRGIMNAQVFDMGVVGEQLDEDTRTPILTRPGDGDFYEGVGFRYADGIPVQTSDSFLGRSLVTSDNNDFAPRLGIAWSPADHWSVRTGAGLFYSQDIGNARFDMARNLGGRDSITADPERPDSNLSDPWAQSRERFTCTGWDGPCVGEPFVLANSTGRRTPYIWQWVLNLQRQLGRSLLIEAGYQGSAGTKLERLRPFNQGINRSGPDDSSSLSQRRPWPVYGTVQETDSVVNSNYHALSLKAQRRFSNGLSFLAGYTWSKSIDGGSGIRNNSGDRLFPGNTYNLAAERGLSQFHVGQRFVASFTYQLPFSAQGLANVLLGDWQIGSIVILSEGSPNTVGSIGDRNNTGTSNYPDATGISPVLDNPTTDHFWNIEAFDTTNPELRYRDGNVGRNVLTNPSFANLDFSLFKNIATKERQYLQIRFEAFNLANHPNWHTPGTNARNARNFGRIFGAKSMRELQFGVKYLF